MLKAWAACVASSEALSSCSSCRGFNNRSPTMPGLQKASGDLAMFAASDQLLFVWNRTIPNSLKLCFFLFTMSMYCSCTHKVCTVAWSTHSQVSFIKTNPTNYRKFISRRVCSGVPLQYEREWIQAVIRCLHFSAFYLLLFFFLCPVTFGDNVRNNLRSYAAPTVVSNLIHKFNKLQSTQTFTSWRVSLFKTFKRLVIDWAYRGPRCSAECEFICIFNIYHTILHRLNVAELVRFSGCCHKQRLTSVLN